METMWQAIDTALDSFWVWYSQHVLEGVDVWRSAVRTGDLRQESGHLSGSL